MGNRDVVSIGTSAGGVEALLFLAKHLPQRFPATILITIHLPSHFRSTLDDILSRAGPLTASFAEDGEPTKKGHMHLAPPGRHLLLDGDRLALGSGARENNARPAIDPMLRSAAVCCSGRTVGVVLTGTLGDGASGLWALGRSGGITVVQDPRDAAFPEMPSNALSQIQPDHVAPLAQIPALLERLTHEPAGQALPLPEGIRFEVEVARNGISEMDRMDRIGRRSVLSCPDCGGVMWEIGENDLVRYRCHIGHAYTAEMMSVAMDEALRRALASAKRGFQERRALMEKLEKHASDDGHTQLAATWRAKAEEFRREADVIHNAIRRLEQITAPPDQT
ncbi:MAG: chemotaxis protein CheB [Acetobacteraceae bacterium]|nr:chemotaxis protein CheB [Acetobacteraceae bacterium]